MALPAEELCGLLGSLLLLYAPARDQILRQMQWGAARRAKGSKPTAKYWDVIRTGYGERRDAWSFWDSATMAAGAILIGASYVIGAP